MKACACGLQCIGEAAEGRCWIPEGESSASKGSPLVEAFIGVTGVRDVENCAVDCWSEPPGDVLHQRDEGAHADVISYLDELAMRQPSRKVWDELMWSPVSSVPRMQHQADYLSYIQGHVVELGPTMPPSWFCMSNQNGGFICIAWRLILEGHVLAYYPNTKEAEWIPVCGTTSDLSHVEEVSALALCNLVPHVPDEGVQRLDWFGKHRDMEGGVGEAASTEDFQEEGMEDESMHEDEGENNGEDVDDEETDEKSESSSSCMQERPCSTCCYSDRHCCPHSWAERSELGDREDGSLGGLSASQGSEGEGESEVGCPPALTSSPLCEQESSSKSTEAAPEEAMPTTGNLPPRGSQGTVIVHAMEDKFKSLD